MLCLWFNDDDDDDWVLLSCSQEVASTKQVRSSSSSWRGFEFAQGFSDSLSFSVVLSILVLEASSSSSWIVVSFVSLCFLEASTVLLLFIVPFGSERLVSVVPDRGGDTMVAVTDTTCVVVVVALVLTGDAGLKGLVVVLSLGTPIMVAHITEEEEVRDFG